jgi:hypothetical protein
MNIRLSLAGFVLSGSILLSTSAWAGTSAIEGIVKDAKGHPIAGADIRIEARAGSSLNKVVKTDAKGHYISSGLPAGTYRVTLLVGGSVKTAINNTSVQGGKSTQLNFDLKPATASKAASSGKKGKHMVWMPSGTGTHMGGNWVEVDDTGAANQSGADRVETASGEAMRKIQQRQTNATGR